MNCRPLANWVIDLVRFGWRQKIIHAQMQNYQSWKFLLKFVCVSMIMFLLEHVLFLKMEFSLCKVWLIRCACVDSQFQRLERNGDAAAHLKKIAHWLTIFWPPTHLVCLVYLRSVWLYPSYDDEVSHLRYL